MNYVLDILKRIDLQTMAGIRRILGIDLTDDMVRIVELEKQGGYLNKYAPKFKATKAYYRRFSAGASMEAKAEETKTFLISCGITTTHAVSSVRTLGVKTLRVSLPANAENTDEWIRENYERLLKIHLPLSQLSYGFEIIDLNESGTRVEITFVRNSDIESYRSFFKNVGLTLIALGAGTRDAANAVVTGEMDDRVDSFLLVFGDSSELTVTRFDHGQRGGSEHLVVNDAQDVLKAVAGLKFDPANADIPIRVAGSIDFTSDEGGYTIARPFGLQSEETLAAGLAVKGFIPEISPVSFLSSQEKEHLSGLMYKSLATRVALTLGLIVVFLLSFQLLASSLIQYKTETLDEHLASAGPDYTVVSLLQRDVERLERRLTGTTLHKSSMARTIHELASAVPDNVWLYKLQVLADGNRLPAISLFGYSTSNEKVAAFLKRLAEVCSEPNLVRSSLPLQSETLVPVVAGRVPLLTFEIKAEGKH